MMDPGAVNPTSFQIRQYTVHMNASSVERGGTSHLTLNIAQRLVQLGKLDRVVDDNLDNDG